MPTTNLKKVTLDQLRVGMHIAKLDISWFDSPFIGFSRRVKSAKDIEALAKSGAKHMVIDIHKGDDIEQQPSAKKRKKQSESRPSYSSTQLCLDIESSTALRNEVSQVINNVMKDIMAGQRVDLNELDPIIEKTIDSLEQNHALFTLTHLSKRSHRLVDHTFATFCLALNMGVEMGFPREELEALGIASIVHELGWMQIPIHLMGKLSPYTTVENALIERHVSLCMKAIKKCKMPDLSVRIIQEHHERCDGSGYPEGLNAEAIHPISKLFSIADRYDEINHQLCDEPGMLPPAAISTLQEAAQNNLFDVDCVNALVHLLGIYPVTSPVKLSNGAFGIVRHVPTDTPNQPLIEIRIDEEGKVLDTPVYLDLVELPTVMIEGAVTKQDCHFQHLNLDL